jgi:hypothetical protein
MAQVVEALLQQPQLLVGDWLVGKLGQVTVSLDEGQPERLGPSGVQQFDEARQRAFSRDQSPDSTRLHRARPNRRDRRPPREICVVLSS